MKHPPPPAGSSAPVQLVAIAASEAATLGNLYQLYAHDFSELVPLAIADDGRFAVAPSERCWNDPACAPFFIRRGAELCGFALARRGSQAGGTSDVMDVAEFFVLRGARRSGVGACAARCLFERFPGPWEVRVRQANPSACSFWSSVVSGSTGEPPSAQPFTAQGVDWLLFSLVVGR